MAKTKKKNKKEKKNVMHQTNCCSLLPAKKYESIPYCLNPFAAREFVLLMQSLQRSLAETSPNIHFVKLWFS